MSIDDYITNALRLVEKHGHLVQTVMTRPPFGYTAGLHRTQGLPEIVVVGLDPRVAHSVLNDIARQMKAGQLVPVENTDFNEVFTGVAARFRPFTTDEVATHLKVATVVNDRADFPAWQLIWPDIEGKFPGDDGVNTNAAAMQDLRFTQEEGNG